MKILLLTSLLLAIAANGQTTATSSGVIKDLTGNPGSPLQFLGEWSSTTSYTLGQAVSYNNAVYISLTVPTVRLPNTVAARW